MLMSPPQVLEKNIAEGNIKQNNASQINVGTSLAYSALDIARERDSDQQFEASMYQRNTNYQLNYDYYYNLNLNAIPETKTLSQEEDDKSSLKVKRSIQFRAKFWTAIFAVFAVPLLNSALVNAYGLSKNIAQNVILSRQLGSVLSEKKDLETKLSEFSSDSGIKRAIKQEMNLVESNEIVVKIVQA